MIPRLRYFTIYLPGHASVDCSVYGTDNDVRDYAEEHYPDYLSIKEY